jgi:hypothetical protein
MHCTSRLGPIHNSLYRLAAYEPLVEVLPFDISEISHSKQLSSQAYQAYQAVPAHPPSPPSQPHTRVLALEHLTRHRPMVEVLKASALVHANFPLTNPCRP